MTRHRLLKLINFKRGWILMALAVLLPTVLIGTVLAANPGDLDTTFGSNGLVYTDIGAATGDKAFAVAIQQDAKIVVAGSVKSGGVDDFAVVRYTSGGIPDITFGINGILTTTIGLGDDVAYAVAVQADDKILVAGSTFNGVDWDFALVRYTAAGVPDATFNSTGVVTTSVTAGDDVARAVVIQPDGKIVVAGHANNDFAVVRYNTNGSLDTTGFGDGDGIVTTDLFGATDRAFAAAIQPDDGKLVVAGFSDSGPSDEFAVVRYTGDGSLDMANFGSGLGWVVTDFSGNSVDQAYSVAVQSDGKIIAAGFVNGGVSDDYAVARYLSSGSLDGTFGTGGKVVTPLSSNDDQAYSMAIQPTGKIVLAGFYKSGGATVQDYAVARYTLTGTLDSTFGSTGVITTDLGTINTINPSADEAYAMALQADNKIVVAGFSDYPAGNDNFAVVRYLSPNSAPTVTDVSKVGIEDTEITFSSGDFLSQFEDTDHDSLVKVQITSLPLPAQGVLELSGTPVTINQEILAADLDNLVFVPTADWNGLASFAWNGSDGIEYAAADASVNLNVNSVNDAPSFTAGVDQWVNEDAGPQVIPAWATSISAGPSDEAEQVLTFTVTIDNSALFASLPAIDSSTGDLTYTPAGDLFGSAAMTVTLRDDGGTAIGGVDSSLPQTFSITVSPVNDAPSFTAGGDQVVDEDAGPQAVSAWATGMSAGPANEAGQVLSFTLTTDSDTLFAALPAIDAVTGDLTYTPADDLYGSATVTVTLRDDGGTANGGVDASLPQTYLITVSPINDAPSFTAGGDQVVNKDAGPQTVSAWATGISAGPANEAGQVLSFTLTTDSDTLFAVLPAIEATTGDLTYTPADNLYGSATVTVTLRDDGGTANGGVDTSLLHNFTITVNPINDPPVVSDVAKVGQVDTEVQFSGEDFTLHFSDIDGDSLVQIQVLSLPAHGSLELSGAPIAVNQEIPILDVDNLTFVPEAGWTGTTSFNWNGSDGFSYALVDAMVKITISPGGYLVYLPLVAENR